MFTATFIDAQGIQQADAVVQVRYAYINRSRNITANALPDGSYSSAVSVNSTVSFGARYWANQQSKDDGFAPYILSDRSGNDAMSAEIDIDPVTAVDLVAAVEAHLQTVVLPSLTGG